MRRLHYLRIQAHAVDSRVSSPRQIEKVFRMQYNRTETEPKSKEAFP